MDIDDRENADDPSAQLVGQVLAGRYRIVAKLGEGAMGAVYLGEHLRIGRRDAIKVLRLGMARDPEAIARFTRGARNVSAIHHPNVCTIYDFGDAANGLQFLAMEFVDGETLKETLDREGRVALGRAGAIAVQVADALQAAHDVGIVHRDLKPGNIMLCRRADGSEAVKVVDFDIAKGPAETDGEEVTRLGFVVGTPEYMSPEQLMGERLDGRSDVYSLAVVLFRMLTGALPFRAATTQEIMVQRLTKDPLRLADVLPGETFPQTVDALLQRSLARQAGDRPASAAEFAQILGAALAGTEVRPGVVTAGRGPVMTGPAATAAFTPAASSQTGPIELPPTRVQSALRPPREARPGHRIASLLAGARLRPAHLVLGLFVLALTVAAGVRALWPAGAAEETADVPGGQVLPQGESASDPPLVSEDAQQPDPGTADVPAADEATAVGDADRRSTSDQPGMAAGLQGWGAGQLDALLARQLDMVLESPSSTALRAIRDTAEMAWNAAASSRTRATAAFVAAQAALSLGDLPGCERWARRGASLDPSQGFDSLLAACR
ncbi:MAG TPA: serine/threonine-protein kinase [Longimicrobiales bacterium]|nr:serine/threonine-protein kinase [Longimicrobiales bacterium]